MYLAREASSNVGTLMERLHGSEFSSEMVAIPSDDTSVH